MTTRFCTYCGAAQGEFCGNAAVHVYRGGLCRYCPKQPAPQAADQPQVATTSSDAKKEG
jgi:hypothetical protein